jgi:hypothetical protein
MLKCWKPSEERLEVGNHPIDLRLLEHYLGDQHCERIRIAPPPWKSTPMPPIPAQQRFARVEDGVVSLGGHPSA